MKKYIFDSEENEIACKDIILAGEVCANCGHNHKDHNPCNCMMDRRLQYICKCDNFEPYVSDLFSSDDLKK